MKPNRKDLRRLKVIEKRVEEIVSCFDGLSPETLKYFNEEFPTPAVNHLREFNVSVSESVRLLKNLID
jgi:hypothetical protein